MSLLNLPDDVLEKILSYISYDEVGRSRLVCRRMNNVSKRVLNRGFHKVERYHAQCLRHVKAQLPRRESERRKHHLARHCDILTAVETRLSLLSMTFMKYIEMNLCCFIPGKVLDEIYKVLRYLSCDQVPFRAHEVLQELRDLSSMAMEHFDEKISPAFRKHKESVPKIITGINIYAPSVSHHSKSSLSRGEHRCPKWKEEMKTIGQRQNTNRKDILSMKQKLAEVTKSNGDLEKKVLELQNLLSTQLEKMKEQDLRIDVLSRRLGTDNSFPPLMKVKTETVPIKTDNSFPPLLKVKTETVPIKTDNSFPPLLKVKTETVPIKTDNSFPPLLKVKTDTVPIKTDNSFPLLLKVKTETVPIKNETIPKAEHIELKTVSKQKIAPLKPPKQKRKPIRRQTEKSRKRLKKE